jgi:arylsulfatase
MDIAPTIYELAGVDPLTDAAFKGTLEMQGTSLLPVWRSDSDSVRDGFMTELFNARAGRDGKWKIANMPRPLGTGQWELYDLSVDPGEANNLAAEHPEILETMVAQYEAFAVENGVIPPFPPPTQTPRRMYPYVCDDACEAAFARFMEMQPRPGAQPPQDQN